MAQMASFLVKDDAATPKEWTVVQITDTPNPFWRSIDSSIPIDGQVRINFVETKLKSGGYKLSVKLEVPVMETLGASGTSGGYVAPPKVAYVTTVITTMFCDRRSTSQDRANAIRMMTGLLQGAGPTTGTGTLQNTGLGQTFLNNAQAACQFFVNLVLPN